MWQPTSTIEILKQRAEILKSIRHFFNERNVLEVETPCLSISTITDPYIQGIEVPYAGKNYYLQTSPEYHMKRLLAAGSEDIFQICKSFRADERGRLHNPEFLMLEWYRLGMDDSQLMDEIDALLQTVLSSPCQGGVRGGSPCLEYTLIVRKSYNAIFQEILNLDLNQAFIPDLKKCATEQGLNDPGWGEDRDAWLLYLFSMCIEPKLQEPTFIYDFPASQASLARLKSNGCAARFELYIKGIELANGFWELSDPKEQAERFERDRKIRAAKNLPEKKVDDLFLKALEAGLPDCSGVALGLDRLIMLALRKDSIETVMSFRE
jgi:lysyl-tRNA synthetase class 2